jgi:hypothetical protein
VCVTRFGVGVGGGPSVFVRPGRLILPIALDDSLLPPFDVGVLLSCS